MSHNKVTRNRSKIGAPHTQIPIVVEQVGAQSTMPNPTSQNKRNNKNNLLYGKQFLGQMVRSHWLIFGRDFTVRTITMETVRLCIFFCSREIQSRAKHKK